MPELAVELATKAAEKVLTRLGREASSMFGVREEIKFIINELVTTTAFLQKAEENPHKDPAAKAWEQQVRELAYAIEDCLDEFSLHLPPRHNHNLADALSGLASLRARHHIAAEIKHIKSRVEEVSNRRLRYGFHDEASNSDKDVPAVQYDPRSAALFVEESELVGIDEPRENIVGWLSDDSPQLRLIVIVGAAGMGKTTAAKRAMESPKITGRHFDCRAWITVSQTFHADDLLRDVIREVVPSYPSSDLDKITKREKLVQILRDHLLDKRYVIAFDDIWKLDAWKSLEDALPKNELGSRILLTTRINEVADSCLACIPGHKHEQEKLSRDQSRELFCKRVFPAGRQACPEELEDLLEEILDKCDGLPLAIVTISAALASKPLKTHNEWKNMLDHFASELQSNPNLRGVLQVLNFSYADLPYRVKKCFLYLSQFPEDDQIKCNRIKRLWMAEGLVKEHRDMSLAEVAESYINILVDRRMILPSTFSIDGKMKSFTIHDTMLEMIISKSVEENFISLLRKNNTFLPQGEIRRLSIHTQNIPTWMSLSRVRSLSMFGEALHPENFQFSFPDAFGLLRVLNLEGHRSFCSHHLVAVCQSLAHLRYLNLRGTMVDSIPNTIGNLQDLETFDIRTHWLEGFKIPSNILKLTKLQFFRGELLDMPAEIRRLTALENLGSLVAKEEVLMGIRYLNQLKKLKIVDSDNKRKAYLHHCLDKMSSSLTSLSIVSRGNMPLLLDMKPAPLQLESLKLEGCLSKLPDWFNSMVSLTEIFLSWMRIGSHDMWTLGSLPRLLKLELHYAYDGDMLHFAAGSFRSLKLLDLYLGNLRSLIFETGAMPSVEIINNNFRAMEEISGIEKLASLKTICTYHMSRTARDLLEKAIEAHPNHLRLIVSSE